MPHVPELRTKHLRHTDTVARIAAIGRTGHRHDLPELLLHLHIGLEPAAGEDHAFFCANTALAVRRLDHNADHFAIGIGELFPEVDEAIEASKSMIIGPEQIEAVKAAQRLIYERVPAFLPIMSWTDFTVRHSTVKNWPRGLGTGYELYQNDWWVE